MATASDPTPGDEAHKRKMRKLWNRTVFDDPSFSARLVIRVSEGAGGRISGELEYFVQVGAETAKEPDEQKRLVRLDREDFKVLLDAQRASVGQIIASALDDNEGNDNVVGFLCGIDEQLDPDKEFSFAHKLLAVLKSLAHVAEEKR